MSQSNPTQKCRPAKGICKGVNIPMMTEQKRVIEGGIEDQMKEGARAENINI
jgi:hypothetical protein